MEKKREIILDTETTGLDPKQGHRIVEIGCLEVYNLVPTGKTFHVYINPERDMPQEAFAVHGLSRDFLSQHPCFREVAKGFLEFIEDAPLVIHNAPFDVKFLNAELSAEGYDFLNPERVIDTLAMARRKFPGSPASLDALCRRFNIDNSKRDKHGALLDASLLADIYLELRGGAQPILFQPKVVQSTTVEITKTERPFRAPRSFPVSSAEKEAHQDLMSRLLSR